MAETISKAYLIHRNDYEMFDEIIGIINEHGNIFSLLALGVKKILSKNSRNLFFGCLAEFEFFASRDIDNKIGKLKKVTLLENNIDISSRVPLILVSKLIYDLRLKGKKIFLWLSETVDLIKQFDVSFDNLIIIKILLGTFKHLGVKICLDKCSCCNSKNIYSFSQKNFGFVCFNHFDKQYDIKYEAEIIKILYFFNNKKNFQDVKFSFLNLTVVIRLLVDYLNEMSGIDVFKSINLI